MSDRPKPLTSTAPSEPTSTALEPEPAPASDALAAPSLAPPSRAPGAARRLAAASPAWRFGVAAAGSLALFAFVYWGFVLSRPGQRLENLALMGAQLRGDSSREASLTFLNQLSVLSFALAIIGLAVVAALRKRPGFGILVAAIMGGSTLLAEILKELLPRPELVSGPAWILRNDFPSGTATVAAALGIGALLVAPDRLRWVILPIGALFAAVIGQSTQITGWHRMSGAIGAVLLVISVAAAGLLLLDRIGHVQRSPFGRVDRRVRIALLAVPLVAFAIAAAVVVMLVAFPLLQVPRDADSVFLHTAFELAGFGFTVVAFIGFGSLIEPYSLGRSASRQVAEFRPAAGVRGPDR